MLHVNMIMLHVDINKSHVNITNMLHVDVFFLHLGAVYATIREEKCERLQN